MVLLGVMIVDARFRSFRFQYRKNHREVRMRKFVLLPLMTAVLTSMFVVGCASTRQVVAIPYGPVAAHNARVIVSRPQKIIWCGARFTVSDNGTQIGELGPGGAGLEDELAGHGATLQSVAQQARRGRAEIGPALSQTGQ